MVLRYGQVIPYPKDTWAFYQLGKIQRPLHVDGINLFIQGDRMWQFAITLFLLQLYPGSLLLVGVYGLVMQLAVVVFGTIVGDWVDNNPRMRGESGFILTTKPCFPMAPMYFFYAYWFITACNIQQYEVSATHDYNIICYHKQLHKENINKL